MNCREVRQLLSPYSDGELTPDQDAKVEQHLLECEECSQQEKSLQSVRMAISSAALYYEAPASLRQRIEATRLPIDRGGFRISLQWVTAAAGVFLLVGASAALGMLWPEQKPTADDELAHLIVANHMRSMQVDHLTDKESHESQTLLSWFQKKIGFSPLIPDLSQVGYELTGGRLDYLPDHPVAGLVYNRGSHVVNIFTWTANSFEDKPLTRLVCQGFRLRHWQRLGMSYWVVSDLNDQESDKFAKVYERYSRKILPLRLRSSDVFKIP